MNSIRVSSIAFGLLCSITGVIAGIFLILQGNEPISGVKISYIGSAYQLSEHDTYFAITLIPNYLYSGITSLLISVGLIYWIVFHLHNKKYGSAGFMLISILQLLSGGGFVIDLALITFLLSLGINSDLRWWKKILDNKPGHIFAVLWFPSLLAFIAVSAAMLFVTLAGMNNQGIMDTMTILAIIMFVPVLFLIFGSLASEIRKF